MDETVEESMTSSTPTPLKERKTARHETGAGSFRAVLDYAIFGFLLPASLLLFPIGHPNYRGR
jgi:hypothetical protein